MTTIYVMSNDATPHPFAGKTAEDLIAHARSMRQRLRDQAEDAEELGHYTQDIHNEMLESGLYHVLTPKRFGGFELPFTTWAKILVEISRGDPGSGWCYGLGHSHNLTTAGWWPQEGQDEIFERPEGYFRASQALAPTGVGKKVDGGYLITATSPYQSGVPFSTHATVCVKVEDPAVAADAPPEFIHALIPVEDFTILGDWGGDAVLGMRASGSNTVQVDEVFIADRFTTGGEWLQLPALTESPGTELYGNPLFLGVPQAFLNNQLVSVVVGAAYAALDEYEEIIKSRFTLVPPRTKRFENPIVQRHFGTARIKADAAYRLLIASAELYEERAADAVENGVPFTRRMDIEQFTLLMQAGDLACEAVELLFQTAGAYAAKKGQRMQRYMRDVQMYRTHNVAQWDVIAQRVGEIDLGLAESIY